ncbi:hypothetical protein F5Y15DRAFT_204011 [Xylariaceae sp. FL0016]|nr:hypothetical protein F5Y15DRAFT_204011 [Xylariaceae sp. FL0016]
MCHGHPHIHACKHTSVKWLYCPEAVFDLNTGYETPCANPIYSAPQPSNVDCPLQNCNYKALKGSWTCCMCGSGPNTQGWCTVLRPGVDWNPLTKRMESMNLACGHGCCSKCARTSSSQSASPELSFSEIRKGKSGRKSHSSGKSSGHHKHSTTYPVVEEDELVATSSSPGPSSPRASRRSGHDLSAESSSRRTKTSTGKKKSHKSRSHH